MLASSIKLSLPLDSYFKIPEFFRGDEASPVAFRARGESVHGGADALAAGVLTGSMHGARSYWRIMRAAAAAAKLRNRAPCLALTWGFALGYRIFVSFHLKTLCALMAGSGPLASSFMIDHPKPPSCIEHVESAG